VRVLFWGTPEFAVPALEAVLASTHTLVGLVTQPDRPRGRSSKPEPSPTKRLLLATDPAIPILQPARPRGEPFRETLAALNPDVSIVAAYGNLLPEPVLELPRFGSLNLHASLLPRHRGAAPVTAAILAGDRVTGITLMRMDSGLDTGHVLLQRATEIAADESAGRLTARLASLAASVLQEGLSALAEGTLRELPQDSAGATYAPRVKPEDARVWWTAPALEIERMLRAYDPWPGAFTLWDGKRVKLFRGRVAQASEMVLEVDEGNDPWADELPEGNGSRNDPRPVDLRTRNDPRNDLRPGEARVAAGPRLFVGTGEGLLEILELQLEGRARMSVDRFLRGSSLRPGSRFE
jgi:methionyl-tRNA formyltransferase